jgi:ribose transport system ATP-binding protein
MFLNEKGMLKAAKELLDSFGINISPKAVVSTLGVGYCQLIEIAKRCPKKPKYW